MSFYPYLCSCIEDARMTLLEKHNLKFKESCTSAKVLTNIHVYNLEKADLQASSRAAVLSLTDLEIATYSHLMEKILKEEKKPWYSIPINTKRYSFSIPQLEMLLNLSLNCDSQYYDFIAAYNKEALESFEELFPLLFETTEEYASFNFVKEDKIGLLRQYFLYKRSNTPE